MAVEPAVAGFEVTDFGADFDLGADLAFREVFGDVLDVVLAGIGIPVL